MPAGKVIVNDAWTLVKTTTKDTWLANGATPVAVCIGSTSGVTYTTGVPLNKGREVIIPAGVSVYAIAAPGRQAPMWWTDFSA